MKPVPTAQRSRPPRARTPSPFHTVIDLLDGWYWEVDAQLRLRKIVGPSAARLGDTTGWVGQALWSIPAIVDDVEGGAALRAKLESGEPVRDLALHGRAFDDSDCWLSFASTPIVGTRGRVTGHRGIVRDITRQWLARLRASTRLQQLRSLLGLMSEYLWESDARHRLTLFEFGRWHPPDGALTSRIGATRWDVPSVYPDADGWAAHRADLDAQRSIRDFEFGRRKANGDVIHYAISGEPAYDADGRFTGYRGVGMDITERKLALGALVEAGDRLNRALDASNLVLWETDIANGWVYLDERWAEFAGGPPGPRRVPSRDLLALVHPDDFDRVRDTLLRLQKGELVEYRIEHRIGPIGGDWKWVRSTGRVTQTDPATGRVLRASGTNADITAEKLQAARLAESEHRHARLSEVYADYYWELGPDLRFTHASGRGLATLGLTPADLVGRGANDFRDTHHYELLSMSWDEYDALRRRHAPYVGVLARYQRRDGARLYLRITGHPQFDADGQFRGYYGITRDVTHEVELRDSLRLSEARFRGLTALSADWWWEQDTEFRFLHVSGMEQRLSVPMPGVLQSSIGRRRWEIEGNEPPAGGWDAHRATLERHEAFRDLVYCARSAQGERVWFNSSGAPTFDNAGNFTGYHGVARDITHRRMVEQALVDSEARFNRAVEATGAGIWDWDLAADLCFFSSGFQRMLGHAHAATFSGFSFRDALHPEDRERAVGKVHATVERGEPFDCEYRLRCADGKYRWFHGRGKALGTDREAPTHFAGLLVNIDDRRHAVDELRESEVRFRTLTELTADWYWEQDRQFRFIDVAGNLEDLTGIPNRDHLGRARWDMPALNLTEADWAVHRATLARHEEFHDFEMRRPDGPDGRAHWVSISGRPVFAPDGSFAGYRGVGRDVTARKLAELALAQSEGRLRFVFETGLIGMAIIGPDGHFLEANDALCHLLGRNRDTLRRMRWDEITHEDDVDECRTLMAALASGAEDGFTVAKRYRRADGTLIYAETSARAMRDATGTLAYFAGLILDVTERTRATRALEASESRFRMLTELSTDSYFELDSDLRYRFVSRGSGGLLNVPTDSLLGQHPWDRASLEPDEAGWAAHRATLLARRPFRDFLVRRPMPGHLPRYLRTSGEPIFDDAGRFDGYRGVSVDATEQIVAARRRQTRNRMYEAMFSSGLADDALRAVARHVEWECDDARCLITTVDAREGHVAAYAAAYATGAEGEADTLTRLADAGSDALTPLVERMLSGARQARTDLQGNPAWTALAGAAQARECWTEPVTDGAGHVIAAVHLLRATRTAAASGPPPVLDIAASFVRSSLDYAQAQHARRVAEMVLRSLNDALLLVDDGWRIVDANPAAAALLGRPVDALRDRSLRPRLAFAELPDASLTPADLARHPERGANVRIVGPGAPERAGTVSVSRLATGHGKSDQYILLWTDTTELQQAHRALAEAHAALNASMDELVRLERARITTIDEEHRRIGEDLHDGLGQHLTGIAFTTAALARDLDGISADAAQRMDRVTSLVNEAIERARDISQGLSPVGPDGTALAASLAQLARRLARTFGLRCEFHCDALLPISDPEVAAHLYRIVQEATTNAVRHGHSSRIEIRAGVTRDAVTLRIWNDGPPPPSPRPVGLGMRTMLQRARSMGGTFNEDATLDEGFAVSVTIPRARGA